MEHHVKDLSGFTMGATDGEIGKIEGFYFDDETWTIRYQKSGHYSRFSIIHCL